MFRKFTVKQNEIAFLFRWDHFVRVLESGSHTVFGRGWSIQTFDLNGASFTHPLQDYLLAKRPEIVSRYFQIVETRALSIAVVRRADQVITFVRPRSRTWFLKGFVPLEIEELEIAGGLVLPTGHPLLESQMSAWVQKYFADLNPGEGAFGVVWIESKVHEIVPPGVRKLYYRDLERVEVAVFPLTTNLGRLLQETIVSHAPELLQHFVFVELGEFEIALVRRGKMLLEIITPTNRAMYYRDGLNELEVISLREQAALDGRVREDIAAAIKGTPLAQHIEFVEVPEYHVGALFIDGKLQETLATGMHVFWKIGRNLKVVVIDTRMKTVDVSGQEILTRDKVALRLNLTVGYRVADPLKALAKVSDIDAFLYREFQFGLRMAVGTRSLDELLEAKGALDEVITTHVREKSEGLGVEIDSAGIKDIILPGEMRAILASVVEAEKVAQANVIRRREETAATRSLLNTARVMEDNPVALRLKELETLERVTEKIDNINVYGGLEGILSDLIKIKK